MNKVTPAIVLLSAYLRVAKVGKFLFSLQFRLMFKTLFKSKTYRFDLKKHLNQLECIGQLISCEMSH